MPLIGPTPRRSFRRHFLVSLAGLVIMLATGVSALAQEASIQAGIPDFFSRADASILIRGLGPACPAMTSVKYVLPCNPAFTDIHTEKLFAAHLFLGNDTSTIRRIEQLINGPHSKEFIEDLFTRHQVIEMEANGEFSFRTRYFAAAFAPYRLTYFSAIRNTSYPVISLHAMKERTLRAMIGGEIEEGAFLGMQVRGVDREFVQDQFTLFDAITDTEAVLQKKTQHAVFFEPGLAYEFQESWRPRVTAYLSNIGVVDREYEEIDSNPILDFGAGVKPPLGFGEWDLAANYHAQKSADDPWRNWSFATSYSLGLLDAIAGVGAEQWSAGVLTSFWSARVGIVYSARKVTTPLGDELTAQTTFTEFSFVF